MFSGQGSQYFHMGKDLFDRHPLFKKWMCRLDEMVIELAGISVLKRLYDENKSKMDVFNQIELTSLAIVMVEYALAQVLMSAGIRPDMILGSSLGEVTASILADIDDLTEALHSVAQRMALYNKHCENGGMIGVLASPELYETSAALNEQSELAAINFDSHFVVSCREEKITPIVRFLKQKELTFQNIKNVSKGYHSSLLDPVEPFIRVIMKDKVYRTPKIKFVSCTHAKPITSLDCHYFWGIFRNPILFQKTIRALEEKGDYIYLDLGPSGTLANFVKYNLGPDSQSEFFPIMTPFGEELNRLAALERMFY